MVAMSEAAAVETHEHGGVQADHQFEASITPGNLGKLGMWTFLAGDAMTFGAGIAAYGALRIGNPNWPTPAAYLGITTTAVMTFILICSSLTMVEALGGIQRGNQSKCEFARRFAVQVTPREAERMWANPEFQD
jgi:heme/copper-type cytochrome/quinol oxidase subunit 3